MDVLEQNTEFDGYEDELPREGLSPVVVGIGYLGENAVKRLSRVDGLPSDLSFHQLLPNTGSGAVDNVLKTLNRTLSGIMVIGSHDSWSIAQVHAMANEMAARDVYIKVAISIGESANDPSGELPDLPLNSIIALTNPWNSEWPDFYQPLS